MTDDWVFPIPEYHCPGCTHRLSGCFSDDRKYLIFGCDRGGCSCEGRRWKIPVERVQAVESWVVTRAQDGGPGVSYEVFN